MSTLGEFIDEGSLPDRTTLFDPDLNPQYASGEYNLNQERKRVMNSPHLSDQEKEGLYEFDKALRDENNRENNRKPKTRSLYLSTARLMQKDSGLLLDTIEPGEYGEERLNELLEWVQNQDYADNYIHKLMISIKTYGELCGSDEVQARFEPITPGEWREDNKPPNPSNVITWADALEMADTRRHTRDAAVIKTLWGSACRPKSEFHELKYKHVKWCGDHYKISVPWDGKTGERTIRLYPGAATLRQWIEHEHPVHDDPDADLGPETYLWTKLNRVEQLSYDSISKLVNNAGKEAGISKDHNPRHFRRSRASYLAGKPTISGHELRNFCGWEINSPAPRAYISKFRTDIDRNIAMADGASTESIENVKVVAPIHCNHCDQLTERGQTDCVCCGGTVDEELHEQSFGLEDPETEGMSIFEIIKEQGITADDIESLERLRPLIKQQGDRLYDDIEMLKRAVEGLEDNQNILTGPGSLAAYASTAAIQTVDQATRSWIAAKSKMMRVHPDMIHPTELHPAEKRNLAKMLAAFFVLWVGSMAAFGNLIPLLRGQPHTVLGLVVALVWQAAIISREMPTLEEAQAAAEEQDG
jgi:integrase